MGFEFEIDHCSVRPRPRLALANRRHRLYEAGLALALLGVSIVPSAFAQHLDQIAEWASNTKFDTLIHQNVVYQKVGSIDLRLDVITAASGPARPVVIYFHGGGWFAGNKDDDLLAMLPYLAWGMDFVSVDYRLASQALAPAAVEDCRCALHWVAQHAQEYGFDATKIVLFGGSAGGHLALMTGMLTPAAGFDNTCEVPPKDWQEDGPKNIRVAAIINLFGPTDLTELLQPPPANGGPDALRVARSLVLKWLGDQPNRMDLAKRLSPLTYIRKDLPPILTVHGDKDSIIPYKQALLLRDALDRSEAPNRLVTLLGGGHGGTPGWTNQHNRLADEAVFQFLSQNGVLPPR